jgi:hypothetical protein
MNADNTHCFTGTAFHNQKNSNIVSNDSIADFNAHAHSAAFLFAASDAHARLSSELNSSIDSCAIVGNAIQNAHTHHHTIHHAIIGIILPNWFVINVNAVLISQCDNASCNVILALCNCCILFHHLVPVSK